jgi:hypothetical protein
MKHIKLIAATALIMGATPAFAANWIYVNTDTKNADNYYDADTLRRSGEVVTVWEQTDHSRDKTVKRRSAKSLIRYYCSRRSYVLVSIIDYYPNGETKRFDYSTGKQSEYFPPPDANGEAMLNAVCAATAP